MQGGTIQPYRLPSGSRQRPSGRVTTVEPRDYVREGRQYASDVRDGRVTACEPVRWAIERQDRDLQRAATDPTWPFVWSDSHAADICAFAEKLPHVEGKWPSPTIVLQPWQCFVLTTLFGWRQGRSEPAPIHGSKAK
jgi:hypothetical protein